MISKLIQSIVVAGFVATLIGGSGCNSSSYNSNPPPAGGGPSHLVISASNPADGDGTLTATATLDDNGGGPGVDEAMLSQTVGNVTHVVVVTWNSTTHVINSAQHVWGNGVVNSGFTQCEPTNTVCDPAKISVNVTYRTVTFSGLVLPDGLSGTSTSTLSGTLVW